MSNLSARQFGEYTLSHELPAMGRSMHRIKATVGDADVGTMAWSSHGIWNLTVEPEHQRKGLATAMWEMGQEAKPRAKHSSDRTDAGDAWAKKVGGRLPRRARA